MSNPPQADRTQLWSNTEMNTAEDAQRAAAAAEAAKKNFYGASDDFLKKQAENDMLYQQRREGDLRFQASRYSDNQAYVDKHNEPIMAAIRAEEERRAAEMMKGVLGAAAAVVGVNAAVGAMQAATQPPATPAAEPSPVSGAFARLLGLRNPDAVIAREVGPSEMFNSRGASPAMLGMAPTLALVGAVLGETKAPVATNEPAMPASLQPAPTTAPVAPASTQASNEEAAPQRPVRVARNQSMHLDLIPVPKPSSSFFQKMGGSEG